MHCLECRDLLSADLDGELTPSEAKAMKHHVAECPDCERARAALAATSRQLKEGLVHYPAPDVLRARIIDAISRPPADAARPAASWARWGRLAAAGIAIAIASSGITVAALHRAGASRSVTDELLTSHVRSLMPGHLIDVASNDQHNVKPWFNGRVNLSPSVPGLNAAGYVLVGGRLDVVDAHPVAVVVYTRRQHVINVYSWARESGDSEPRESSATVQGYHLVHWRDGNVELWAVSDLNSTELGEFRTLYQRGASAAAR